MSDFIIKSIEKTNYKPGVDVFIAIDVASSEFYKDQKYILKSEKLELSADQMIDYYKNLIKSYPILSIEDGLDENDWNGWKK